MEDLTHFLIENGYSIVFLVVFLERVGVPIPALFVLVAMGALVARGELMPLPGLAIAVAACLMGDLVWYELGRRHGARILGYMCKISLEPDSCVRSTKSAFGRHGARALLLAKFIPPFSFVAPPLAGQLGMPLTRFLVYDGLSAALWVGTFSGAGYLFDAQLELLAVLMGQLSHGLLLALIVVVVVQIGAKLWRRKRQLRDLQTARVTPEELKQQLDSGDSPLILDLRHSAELSVDPATLPGALRIPGEALAGQLDSIPRGREVILYCS